MFKSPRSFVSLKFYFYFFLVWRQPCIMCNSKRSVRHHRKRKPERESHRRRRIFGGLLLLAGEEAQNHRWRQRNRAFRGNRAGQRQTTANPWSRIRQICRLKVRNFKSGHKKPIPPWESNPKLSSCLLHTLPLFAKSLFWIFSNNNRRFSEWKKSTSCSVLTDQTATS